MNSGNVYTINRTNQTCTEKEIRLTAAKIIRAVRIETSLMLEMIVSDLKIAIANGVNEECSHCSSPFIQHREEEEASINEINYPNQTYYPSQSYYPSQAYYPNQTLPSYQYNHTHVYPNNFFHSNQYENNYSNQELQQPFYLNQQMQENQQENQQFYQENQQMQENQQENQHLYNERGENDGNRLMSIENMWRETEQTVNPVLLSENENLLNDFGFSSIINL